MPEHRSGAGAPSRGERAFRTVVEARKMAEQALQESEQKYRELIENAAYGIYRSNAAGDLLEVNPLLVEMLGYGSKEELMTRKLSRDIYENPADRAEAVEKCELSGKVEGVEVNWKRKDGKRLVVRLKGRVVRGDRGDPLGFEVMVDDITERRSLEEQLRQAQKMEAVGLLAGGIAHDFNNLLGVILANTELMLDAPRRQDPRRYAEEVKKAGQRAADLTRQLLAFSRRQVLYPVVLNLNTVTRELEKILQRLIGEDVQIVSELEAELGPVLADRGQIEQIIMNLAANARDAMPEGGKLTIRTSNARLGPEHIALYPYVHAGEYVHLSVSDTGVGMSEEVRTRIFEPFFTTKAQGRGTGLGLSTVYGIVKQSGGYIWATSELGAGTTFDIYLPKVKAEALFEAPDQPVEFAIPATQATVLVVEDEPALREVTAEMLLGAGYEVLQAGSGKEALRVAESYRSKLALVISDVVLPDTSGPEIMRRLRATCPELKSLYVTGYAQVPVVQKLIAEGAILLQKPVGRVALLKKVYEVLSARSLSAASCD